MEQLKINSGIVRLQVVDDYGNERGIFQFNPTDIMTAKLLLDLQADFSAKQVEFDERERACKDDKERIDLLVEIVDYLEKCIDDCFGEGSSYTLFGEAKTLTMFQDFFDGIIPFYEKASQQRMAKYKKK